MAGKVCIGCGLKTDDSGNLIVDTNEAVWPLTKTCADTNGTPVYCTADGSLHGPAEKFFRMKRFGKNHTPDNQVPITTYASAGGGKTSFDDPTAKVGSIQINFTNPSPCLPMNFLIETGISHVKFDMDGPGDYLVEAGVDLDITGAVTLSQGGGHQIWRHSSDGNEKATFDTMGARAYATQIVIPAAGVITITVTPFLIVTLATGTCTIQNWTSDLVYTAWND